MRESMEIYPITAAERAMKLQEVRSELNAVARLEACHVPAFPIDPRAVAAAQVLDQEAVRTEVNDRVLPRHL
jgi:hypothetical protein